MRKAINTIWSFFARFGRRDLIGEIDEMIDRLYNDLETEFDQLSEIITENGSEIDEIKTAIEELSYAVDEIKPMIEEILNEVE